MGRLGLGIFISLVLASMSLALARQQTEHGGRPLTANLTGAAEVPGPGDADGAGSAGFRLGLKTWEDSCSSDALLCGLIGNDLGCARAEIAF